MQKLRHLSLFLLLLGMTPALEAYALPPDPNAPATIGSVNDAKKDIVETLVSLITGLAATATDLMYMSTPSTQVAMSTNSALTAIGVAGQTDLRKLLTNPIKFSLTGYEGYQNPSLAVDASLQNLPTPPPAGSPTLNSGFLVLDIFNALDNQISNISTTGEPVVANLCRPGTDAVLGSSAYLAAQPIFNQLIALKRDCAKENPSNPTDCANLPLIERTVHQDILNSIFNSSNTTPPSTLDPLVANYAAGDVFYNPEVLLAATSYAADNPPGNPSTDDQLLDPSKIGLANNFINQLSQFAGIPDARPPSLPEPMTDTEVKNLKAAITQEAAGGPSNLDQIQLMQQTYIQAVMEMVAGKNLIMDSIYAIHAKRIPKISIYNQNLTNPATGQRITSQQQLETYAANRRLTPDYYAEMAAASPGAVSRETLFVLAEIRQQLFQNQVMQERLLAAVSMQALGSMASKGAEVSTIAQTIRAQIGLLLSGNLNTVNKAKDGNITGITGTPP